MKVAILGSTGLIGHALDTALREDGHHVIAISRGGGGGIAGRASVRWDAQSPLDPAAIDGCDAVVNLAGASIDQRWTRGAKDEIFESRVRLTEYVADAVRAATVPVLVNGSAVGYYGAGEAPVTERAAHGTGFLADVCVAWEAAAQRAEGDGCRVVRTRMGIVLAAHGGALKRMLLPARLGLVGPIAGGRQWLSWVHLADAVAALRHAITTSDISGAMNVVAPRAVRQRDFVSALGKVVRRPSFLPAPRVLVRAVMGESASIITTGQRVVPAVLEETGFTFHYPDVRSALENLLRRTTG